MLSKQMVRQTIHNAFKKTKITLHFVKKVTSYNKNYRWHVTQFQQSSIIFKS